MSEDINAAMLGAFASWTSYPKLFALGHRSIHGIFEDEVIIEEKIDGSQFSFGVIDGELRCRSKGAQLNIVAPEKMFVAAVETAQRLAEKLTPNWTYRGEYLQRPKHNTLVYDRIPSQHVIGFDVSIGHEKYLSYDEKVAEFARLGLETVPCVYRGKIETPEKVRELLQTKSILGAQMVEGVVVKNYHRLNPFGQLMIGKFVSEEFKEVHSGDWSERNPTSGDIIEVLIGQYRTPARWAKAVQHLREKGQITDSPQDIGSLFKEVHKDIKEECEQELKDKLYKWAIDKVLRGCVGGLPQWYKEQLLKQSFETPNLSEVRAE